MTVAVVYCHPVPSIHGNEHKELAYRFIATWLQFQPMAACELFTVSNGGEPEREMQMAFSSIPMFKDFLHHDDSGWDVGAFQKAAQLLSHDVLLLCGGNLYFKQSGWLKRMIQAIEQRGPTLYGAFASTVHCPHIRTTGFWMPRDMLNQYPKRIVTHDARYDFEHRTGNLTEWCESIGRTPLMVTWSGVYGKDHWGRVPGSFGAHRSDNSECLFGDRISDLIKSA